MDDILNTLFLGRKFKALLKHSYEPVRKKYDLKQVEIEVLSYLAIFNDATSTDVYRGLNLNKGHVSQATIHLQENDLIELHINPNDKRSATYSLTEKGYSVYSEIMQIYNQILSTLFRQISEKEKGQFLLVSDKVLKNIDTMLA